ncbi:LLM class flavin-dependent oxidoreductase [Cohnella terricola]|uniref:LLM class flavin-dependent oxidoreductase n=1 Tax=Cohnella terricola TaxID=1289167 RepID=A0A559JT84_9BACL|nr:LLM class flavin-dependent oxidoreductase [Cohnella terricola]TVY03081.1 LLM class flavin-dependent oxidoreductase [Cohnella terricola]
MSKQIRMNAFDMTSAMHNSHGLWKHPLNVRTSRYKDLDYWTELAQLLERGKFDAIFLADVIGVYDVYGQNKDAAIRDAVQVPLNDPAFVIPAMAQATKHLSFALTVSTTYEHPYAHARRMSTLDHLTKGRLAWNVVTSYLPSAARNFGLQEMMKHDDRYEMADEFLEVVYKLWEASWEDHAIVHDVENRMFTDPAKVHEINHSGKYFKVPGPHLSEPSLQRTPVIYQAGGSQRGSDFAARHAECIFVGGQTPAQTKQYIQDIKNRAESLGRNPDHIKAFTFLNVVVAETTEEAEAKYEEYASLWSPEAAKAQYGGSSGYDLSQYSDLDAPFEYKHTEHGQSRAASLTKDNPKKLTVREVLNGFEQPGRKMSIVGNPQEVADGIQSYFEASGVDGFNLAHMITPGSLIDFVDLVVPELQKRGVYKTEYAPGTFREKLFGENQRLLPTGHPGANFRRG